MQFMLRVTALENLNDMRPVGSTSSNLVRSGGTEMVVDPFSANSTSGVMSSGTTASSEGFSLVPQSINDSSS